MYTRRDFGKAALAAFPLAAAFAKPNSKIAGVEIGAQSYSFRDRPLDEAIKAFGDVGLSYCELYQNHVEPKLKGPELKKWRETSAIDTCHDIRKKFDAAGITLYAVSYGFRENFTDEDMDRPFEMAKALGVGIITTSTHVSMAERIYPYAEKHKIKVGMHNHSNLRPDDVARPDDFAEAMKGRTPWIGINLDIGHFVAAGFDPLEFLKKEHEHIFCLHLKDRTKSGDNLPFGTGQTPICEVLQTLKKNQWNIPAGIEYEYRGDDSVVEVKKAFAYCKKCLA
jgi:sugar phosphate isomerase/epimerase